MNKKNMIFGADHKAIDLKFAIPRAAILKARSLKNTFQSQVVSSLVLSLCFVCDLLADDIVPLDPYQAPPSSASIKEILLQLWQMASDLMT